MSTSSLSVEKKNVDLFVSEPVEALPYMILESILESIWS
jgi:hypothetical protein